MDGIHDIGGIDGFGAVEVTPAERVFAADWERRALRTMMATIISLDAGGARFRHSIERMDPAHYLASSYYEHWLTGISSLLVEAGITTSEDLDRRADGRFPLARQARGDPPPASARDRTEARFGLGDRVRVRSWHPLGHTRAPRYIQGKRGVIVRLDGPANLPDFEAHGGQRILDPTYSVRFESSELWGEAGEPNTAMNVDVWERYLQEDQ